MTGVGFMKNSIDPIQTYSYGRSTLGFYHTAKE